MKPQSASTKRLLFWLPIAILLLGGIYWAFRPRPILVDLAKIERQDLIVTIEEDARTRVKEVFVVSAPIRGRLTRIGVEVGDAVEAGEPLATIFPSEPDFLDVRSRREAEAAISTAVAAEGLAETELARAEAERDFARSERERIQALVRRNVASNRELDIANLELRVADAGVAQARALLAVRRGEVERARAVLIEPQSAGPSARPDNSCCVNIHAPASGQVLEIIRESEQILEAGMPLLDIGDPAQLEVVADLLSSDAVRVAEGAMVDLSGWGGSVNVSGKVRRIEPAGYTKVSALGIDEQRVDVLIDITSPRDRWKGLGHGYRVDVEIEVWRAENTPSLPLGALFRRGESWAVYRVVDNLARLTEVTLGPRNRSFAQVLDGLEDGDRVIIHPSDQIEDGSMIEPRSAI